MANDPQRRRGVVRQGVRGGLLGLVGCLTFVIVAVILFGVLIAACAQAAGS